MIEIDLDDLLADLRDRKAEIGMEDDEAQTEHLRNKGGRRTPEKRELLRRAEDRAIVAGIPPIKAYF